LAETKKKSSGSRSRSSSNGRPKGVDLVRKAAQQLAELTGRPPSGVLGLEREDKGWRVTFELVELERIPHSTDLLGAYAVRLDEDGELVGYERTHRYQRGQADGGGR
jgi:Gas vesicle synthesis protein GvpO